MTSLIKSLGFQLPLWVVITIGIVTWCQKSSSKLSSSSNCSLKPLRVTCKTWKSRNSYNTDRHLWLDLWFNTTSFFTDFYVECTSTRTVGIKRKALGQLEKMEASMGHLRNRHEVKWEEKRISRSDFHHMHWRRHARSTQRFAISYRRWETGHKRCFRSMELPLYWPDECHLWTLQVQQPKTRASRINRCLRDSTASFGSHVWIRYLEGWNDSQLPCLRNRQQ